MAQLPIPPPLNESITSILNSTSTITTRSSSPWSTFSQLIMQPLTLLLSTLLSLPILQPFALLNSQYHQICKPLPADPHWPPPNAWSALNDTIGGRLLSPDPPGAVCHPTQALYNNDSCIELRKNWLLSDWHAQNPITSDYNDDTCIPDERFECSRDGYPAYTVNASRAEDVVAAVGFAGREGVRLVIKGTGHDFPGRSAGAGSLSIHTHYLRGISVDRSDARATKYGGVAAVKIAAGMRMFELYEQMAEENLTIVAGADMNVGIGGWSGGGGHSPVSALFGMGADNVLEMEVVTADGKVRVLNGESEGDGERLFWALRGGGPSTYAVMLSVTMIAYPPVYLPNYIYMYNTTASSSSFWNMTALFHQHLPRIAEAGGMGYYFTLPNITILAPNPDGSTPGGTVLPFDPSIVPDSQKGLIFGTFLFNTSDPATVSEIMGPLEQALRDLSKTQPDPINAETGILIPALVPFSVMWPSQDAQTVGSTHTRLGSWLLGGEGLSKPLDEMAAAFAAASGAVGIWPQLGHLVSGPGVHRHKENPEETLPGGGNAILPAWRTAYTHVVLPASWGETKVEKEFATKELWERVNALRGLEEGSGAYMNEADPTNEEWKHDYFGEDRYEELLAVKEMWDPKGVFWCRTCVGSDLWEWTEREEGAQGVGQEVGRLCMKEK